MSRKKKLTIKDLVIKTTKIPILSPHSLLKEALEEMCKRKLGICFCIKDNGKLIGILTDGDLRRKILNIQKPFSALLNDDLEIHINKNPTKVKLNQTLTTALNVMKKKLIWDLPVVDKTNKLIGMLHLHPVVKALIKK